MRTIHTRLMLLVGCAAAFWANEPARAQQSDIDRLIAATNAHPPAMAQHRLEGEIAHEVARIIGPNRAKFDPTTIALLISRSLGALEARKDAGAYGTFELWRSLALDVTALDHVGYYDMGKGSIVYDQYGPPRTSRALALVHIAMFEVANAVAPPNLHAKSWLVQHGGALPAVPADLIESVAIAAAANDVLRTLYNGQAGLIAQVLSKSLAQVASDTAVPTDPRVKNSLGFGKEVAERVLMVRDAAEAAKANQEKPKPVGQDASWTPDPTLPLFVPNGRPSAEGVYPSGQWSPDPVSDSHLALGASWGELPSFTTLDPAAFTVPDPHTFSADIMKKAYDQVLNEGVDVQHHGIRRRDDARRDRYYRAKFWAYDATAGICAPVRLYDQIAAEVLSEYTPILAPDLLAASYGNAPPAKDVAAVAEVARYYALLNAAMADAAIVAWHEKYRYQYWRPVVAIRRQQQETQPPVSLDNLHLYHQELWYPLGAQNTNSEAGFNITPPFPAYPSGHAVFGAAFFQVLRRLVPNDNGFSFWSDEFNSPQSFSTNVDAYNFVRCYGADKSFTYCAAVKFRHFADAEIDNALSRVWMGVHWNFDASCGNALGEKVGDFAVDHSFTLDRPAPAGGLPSKADVNNCASQGQLLHEPGLPEPVE